MGKMLRHHRKRKSTQKSAFAQTWWLNEEEYIAQLCAQARAVGLRWYWHLSLVGGVSWNVDIIQKPVEDKEFRKLFKAILMSSLAHFQVTMIPMKKAGVNPMKFGKKKCAATRCFVQLRADE
ncbi:hypothetical protein L5515_009530 [Caenorhabditis briggsae]|uniref:Uncharacterized protein n=1 Tax=Caenorhabditis briggsae TaxID=6238 RepID=A0AAE9F3Q8_CAEBR|nr:hypothetical protein L5515_009530 [Caenorhabditis briggsae]